MQSATRSKRKSARHAISGLLAQPTPGSSSSSTVRLSKSFDNQGDLISSDHWKPGQRRMLRPRRNVGSAESNKGGDLHFLENEEDTETPRAHIEAFLTNVDTNPEAERSSTKKHGRPNARSFTRTPNTFSKNSPGIVKLQKSNLSLPSPGSLLTPRANIEQFLHGSGSEHSPRTRSMVSQENKSDIKILSSNKSKNWGQRISTSPLYQPDSGDVVDESRTGPEASFKTLQKRKSFHIPELPGLDATSWKLSQQTPVKRSIKDSRLSKSDSKIKPGSGKWAQRVSTSPLNHSDFGGEVVDGKGVNTNRFFKHTRLHRSFHIPEVATLNDDREEVFQKNANASETNEEDPQHEDEYSMDITIKNQSNKTRQDALLQSFVPSTNSNLSQEQLKDKMKVYDLSDGSSDLDFSPPQSIESKHKKSTTLRSGSQSIDKTLTSQSGPTPISSGQRRLRSSSSPHFRTPSSIPKASYVNSSVRDSISVSKRRRLRLNSEEAEANHLQTSERKEKQSSSSEATIEIPFAPPSSTPVKRHIPSLNKSNDSYRDLNTNFSHQKQVDRENVSILANDILQGLSPIRSLDEDKEEFHNKAMDDMMEVINEGLVPHETELSQAVETRQEQSSQKSIECAQNKEPENAELLENESTRDTKKGTQRKKATNSRKSSEDVSFVSRKMVKFYAELFSTSRLDKEVIDELVKASEELWKDNLKTAEGYAQHAGRKTITEADIVLLMKVQRLIGSTEELHDLIREYLPMDLRCALIPTVSAHFPTD